MLSVGEVQPVTLAFEPLTFREGAPHQQVAADRAPCLLGEFSPCFAA
jgi:hypothetical protein